VDDILTVPFSPEELVARVVAVVRRTYRDAAIFSLMLRLGDPEIDIANRRVRAGGTEPRLTSLEQSPDAVSAARDRDDVSRPPRIVLQLDAQIAGYAGSTTLLSAT